MSGPRGWCALAGSPGDASWRGWWRMVAQLGLAAAIPSLLAAATPAGLVVLGVVGVVGAGAAIGASSAPEGACTHSPAGKLNIYMVPLPAQR